MTQFFRPYPKPEKKIKEPYKGLKRTPLKKKPFIKDGAEITGTPDLIIILDGVMSEFVRLINADRHGIVRCFTCPSKLHWTDIENGHFVPRKNLATRFNIWNQQPQCPYCNGGLAGNLEVYEIRLDEKYGAGTSDYLKRLGKTTLKRAAHEYEEMIQAYKVCVENLKENLTNY